MAGNDVLKADLEVGNERESISKIDNFYKKLKQTAEAIDNLPDGNQFAAAFTSRLSEVSKTAEKTRATFSAVAQFDTRNNSFDGLSKSAIRLSQETVKAQASVRATQRIVSEYRGSNQSLFRVLTKDAEDAENALAKLERRADQFANRRNARGGANGLGLSSFQKTNLGYQANDVLTQAALGQSPGQILASQGGQIAQIFSAEQIGAFTTKYAALVPVLGAGAAALALTYKITGDIRDAAEVRLKTEEKIAGILNKQRLAAQALTDEFNKKQKDDDENRRIRVFQEDTPIEQIRARRDLLKQLLDLKANDTTDQSAPIIAAYRKEFDILKNQLQDFDRNREKSNREAADRNFQQRKDDFEKNLKLEEEARKKSQIEGFKNVLQFSPGNVKLLQSELQKVLQLPDAQGRDRNDLARAFQEQIRSQVQAGKDEVEKLRNSTETLFRELYSQAGANNPFVAVFNDAESAIERTKLQTASLSDELKKTALDLVANQNAANLFSARLDTGLQAIDLRSDAERFRGASRAANRPKPITDAERDQYVKDYLSQRNPVANGATFNNGRTIDTLSAEEKQKIFTSQFVRFAGDGNENAAIGYLASLRAGEKPTDSNLTIQEKLQKQLDFVDSLGAKTEAEKQIADRKIIALTQSLDPATLSDRERSSAATARENEARRLESAEKVAQAERETQGATLKSLDTNIGELLKIAKSDGLTGVIRIINEAEDDARVSLGKRPNDRSTEKMTQ